MAAFVRRANHYEDWLQQLRSIMPSKLNLPGKELKLKKLDEGREQDADSDSDSDGGIQRFFNECSDTPDPSSSR
jgi:hypothetical protein